jgi:hypothetical protein
VKLLFDHCVPRPFRRELVGHEVKTAYQMGWSNLGNGKLLEAAARSFDALITVDQNIPFQQNLQRPPLSVLILVAVDNDPETLKPYAPFVLEVRSRLTAPVLVRIYADGRVEVVTGES